MIRLELEIPTTDDEILQAGCDPDGVFISAHMTKNGRHVWTNCDFISRRSPEFAAMFRVALETLNRDMGHSILAYCGINQIGD
jgi:hypothetical protein